MPREIALSSGLVAIVDDIDFAMVSQWRWSSTKCGKSIYAKRSAWPGDKTIYMHRVILGVADGVEVDHINNNGLDNQRSNLRPATHSQNGVNNRQPLGESGYRGVYRNNNSGWQVVMAHQGKTLRFGTYPTPEEAARVWDEMAIQYRGEFAVLNFPDGCDS